jgi:hypothetical protein
LCQIGLSCTVSFTHNECLPLVGAGKPCRVGVPSHCEPGHFCTANPEAGMWEGTCEAKLQEGASCNEADQCDPSLECVAGTCSAAGFIGESCAQDDGCYSENCVSGTCKDPDPCKGAADEN